MKVSEVVNYLLDLEDENFTGSITLNFHCGNLSSKIEKKISERVEDKLTTA